MERTEHPGNSTSNPGSYTGASMADPEAPTAIRIDLEITEADLLEQLQQYPEGRIRQDFVRTCLRIGMLALKQAEGQVDAVHVRNEGERLLSSLENYLTNHRTHVTEQVEKTLKDYFDPNSGRFNERLEQLLRKDGELERVLRSQVGEEDSAIAKTLASHLGEHSPLMKVLSTDESTGILRAMNEAMNRILAEEREGILKEFSLDRSESALSRLVRELNDSHGKLTGNLQESIQSVVGEFSLDKEDSALSRLVKRVEVAQKQISDEFSLDSDSSALARMKKELMDVLDQQRKSSNEFQSEIRASLAALTARKEEAARTTTHGNAFESELHRLIQARASDAGEVVTATGNTTGIIRNCKVGDIVVELSPDHVAAGAKIVFEAKDSASYDLKKALDEIETGRKNRDAQIGVFVFSKQTAPEGLNGLTRYGDDIVTVWDIEDETTDLYPEMALSVARALCTRKQAASEGRAIDATEMDRAIRDIEKQASGLEEITTWAETIKKNGDKIVDKARIMTDKIMRQVNGLDRFMEDIKQLMK